MAVYRMKNDDVLIILGAAALLGASSQPQPGPTPEPLPNRILNGNFAQDIRGWAWNTGNKADGTPAPDYVSWSPDDGGSMKIVPCQIYTGTPWGKSSETWTSAGTAKAGDRITYEAEVRCAGPNANKWTHNGAGIGIDIRSTLEDAKQNYEQIFEIQGPATYNTAWTKTKFSFVLPQLADGNLQLQGYMSSGSSTNQSGKIIMGGLSGNATAQSYKGKPYGIVRLTPWNHIWWNSTNWALFRNCRLTVEEAA